METTQPRPLHAIAYEIRRAWRPVSFAAAPYLSAMSTLEHVDDRYGYDTGRSIVAYFLSNATTWRGDDARRIKAELRAMIKR